MKFTDEVSWSLTVLRGDSGSPGREDRDEGHLTPIARQLSQVDRQENHLKPELISLSEREQNFRYLLTSLDGMCHRWAKDGAREEHRQTAQTDSKCHFRKRQCRQCLFKSATVQLPLQGRKSLSAKCKLLNSSTLVALMSRTLYLCCNHSPCVKTHGGYVCVLAKSYKEGASALYLSIFFLNIFSLITIEVCLLFLQRAPSTAAAAGLMIY